MELEKHKCFNFPSNIKAFRESVWLVGDDLGDLVHFYREEYPFIRYFQFIFGTNDSKPFDYGGKKVILM